VPTFDAKAAVDYRFAAKNEPGKTRMRSSTGSRKRHARDGGPSSAGNLSFARPGAGQWLECRQFSVFL